MIFIYLVYTSK